MYVIESKITEVKAFRNSATLTRTGRVCLKKGENRFYLTGGFAALDQGSVRFWFTEGDLSGSVQVLNQLPSDDEELSLKENGEIISLKRELELIGRKIADRKFDLDVWMEYTRRAGASEGTDSMEERLGALEAKRKEYYAALDELEQQKEKAENELRKLEECEDERRKAAASPCIEVRTYAGEDAEAGFLLEYRITNAGWVPSYELVIDKLADPYTVLFKGSIRQNTGENWEHVQVTFSGSEPQMSFGSPNLKPVYVCAVDSLPPKPRFTPSPFAAVDKYSNSSFGDVEDAGMEMSSPFSEDTVSPSRRLLSQEADTIRHETTTEFRAAGRWDIPGDFQPVSIDIKSYKSTEGLTLTAYPYAGNFVYYETKLPEEMRPELIGGNASVYIERTFFGRRFINPGDLEDDARLTLGNDRQILVERRQTRREKNKVPLRAQERTFTEYVTTIFNRRSEAVDVLVYDRLPVSKDSNVTVTVSELSGGTLDDEREGIVCWPVHLEGGEKKKLVYSYQTTFPAGRIVREY